MIVHSIVPFEQIFGQDAQQGAEQSIIELDYKGVKVEASRTGDGYRIRRILSTTPGEYLNPILQPGKIIRI